MIGELIKKPEAHASESLVAVRRLRLAGDETGAAIGDDHVESPARMPVRDVDVAAVGAVAHRVGDHLADQQLGVCDRVVVRPVEHRQEGVPGRSWRVLVGREEKLKVRRLRVHWAKRALPPFEHHGLRPSLVTAESSTSNGPLLAVI